MTAAADTAGRRRLIAGWFCSRTVDNDQEKREMRTVEKMIVDWNKMDNRGLTRRV